MSAATVTFDDLEEGTYLALARTSKTYRYVRESGAHLTLASNLLSVAWVLKGLVRILSYIDLERLPSHEGVTPLIENLTLLHGRVISTLQASEQKGLTKNIIYRPVFGQIREAAEEIEDILENYYLSSNGEFRQIVENAISELKPTKSPPDWRSSLAKLQD